MKTGGRLVKHARYYWLLLAEGHLTRRVFGAILRRIWGLAVAGGVTGTVAVQKIGQKGGPSG